MGKPIVYVVDDDPVFCKLINQILKKYGVTAEVFSTFDSILQKIENKLPTLCLVDLNLESQNKGFELIQTIRTQHSKTLPIFIVSSDNNQASVAHAIEVGANDYLFKPLDRNILLSKLSNYLNSPELEMALMESPQLPERAFPVSLKVEVELQQIDEMGLTITTNHLISKGSVLTISGTVVDEILGKDSYILVTAISNSIEANAGVFKTFLEYDSAQDKEIPNKVRSWIQSR